MLAISPLNSNAADTLAFSPYDTNCMYNCYHRFQPAICIVRIYHIGHCDTKTSILERTHYYYNKFIKHLQVYSHMTTWQLVFNSKFVTCEPWNLRESHEKQWHTFFNMKILQYWQITCAKTDQTQIKLRWLQSPSRALYTQHTTEEFHITTCDTIWDMLHSTFYILLAYILKTNTQHCTTIHTLW